MKIADILDKAADLIEPEGAWTQDAYGRNEHGSEVVIVGEAVCYCAMGAIYAAASKEVFEHDEKLLAPLIDLLGQEGECGIDDWNDASDRTQAGVVAKLREAAAKAREQGL